MAAVAAERIRALNARDIRPERPFILYWMIAARRLSSSFALQRAASLAIDLGRPLVVFEPLRVDYQWASDRLHRFVIDGMADHARAMAARHAVYVPHVERARGDGRRLFEALARQAAIVVTDDYPAFFLPGMVDAAAARLDVRGEAVDGNGLLPMRAAPKAFPTARGFRAHMQRELRGCLAAWPADIPWTRLPRPSAPPVYPSDADAQPTRDADLHDPRALIAALPIDHGVPAVGTAGGPRAAAARLATFVADRLPRYADDHRHPDLDGTSRLSPYLHFGHLSPHDVFTAVMSAERWTSRKLGAGGGGRREGWWGVSVSAEAFLDQLVTWRELAFNTCVHLPGRCDTVDTLPAWALATLERHARDPRPWRYSRDDLDRAGTHDPIWNAAQRQLVRDGWMHNYLRMLWGKKILEWSETPAHALEAMISIMNRRALDGRGPTSSAGYGWVLGRYDRAWGPERPVFGTVRYMSSANTARKLKITAFLRRYGPDSGPGAFLSSPSLL